MISTGFSQCCSGCAVLYSSSTTDGKYLIAVFVGRRNKIWIFENCFCGALDLKVKSCLSRHGNIAVVWVGATVAHCLRTGRVTYTN